MSTFDGIVQEFPFITIDYFRKIPERPPPLACFLSHVHSDHLQGLESFRAPFIYCSTATRELLLRIEKYPHRMNFSNGILESRRLHYKHLSKLLRPIPLNTPTEIDLTPRLSIRVTLLDANHCSGAVMFLIEGDGKAILYTGDVRAEPWWVNSLIRNPVIIPYTLGNKRLDKLYLDTTFAHSSHAYRTFPSKAEGLAELLRKVECYPEEVTFYFRAWTFGYEEVWMALSAALRSKVHVDRYQMRLYKSLSFSSREGSRAAEAPFLCGFDFGNIVVPGCLTEDERSRIHSCEPGAHCSTVSSNKTVYITPIVSRTEYGSEVPEVGAGGGRGDLYQTHELELPDPLALERLEQLCRERIHDPQALSKARQALFDAFKSRNRALSLDSYGMKDVDDMPLDELVNILSRGPVGNASRVLEHSSEFLDKSGSPLPRNIHFPYSRHSSYAELCELVAAFRPKDIHPCTVDPLDWDEDISMQSLFSHLCSDNQFVHDQYMRGTMPADDEHRPRKRPRYTFESPTQSTQETSMIRDNDSDQRPSHILADRHMQRSSTSTTPSSRPLPTPLEPAFSSPSSDRTPLPITEPHVQTEPLHVSTPTPDFAKAKRNAIREAWHFLHNAQSQHDHFHLGPLPSSWPTDNENPNTTAPGVSMQSQRDIILSPIPIPIQKQNELAPVPEETIPNSPCNTYEGANPDLDPDLDPGMEAEAEAEAELEIEINPTLNPPQPNPCSQQSHILSISSSAFASQSQEQRQRGEDPLELIAYDERTDLFETDLMAQSSSSSSSSSSLGRDTSARRTAYLAARADNYEAWASMALVSTGDNHAEEEIEL